MLRPSKTKVLLIAFILILGVYILAFATFGRWGLLSAVLSFGLLLFLILQAPLQSILQASSVTSIKPLAGKLDVYDLHKFLHSDLLKPQVRVFQFQSSRVEAFVIPRFRFQSEMHFSTAWLERFDSNETQIAAEVLTQRLKWLANPIRFIFFRLGLCFYYHSLFLKSLALQSLFVPTLFKSLALGIFNQIASPRKILFLDQSARLNELQRNSFCSIYTKCLHLNINTKRPKSSLPNLLFFTPELPPTMGALRERSLTLTGSFPHG